MQHILKVEREVEQLCQIQQTNPADDSNSTEVTHKMKTIVERLNLLIAQSNKV